MSTTESVAASAPAALARSKARRLRHRQRLLTVHVLEHLVDFSGNLRNGGPHRIGAVAMRDAHDLAELGGRALAQMSLAKGAHGMNSHELAFLVKPGAIRPLI